jgi:hypothetical protein
MIDNVVANKSQILFLNENAILKCFQNDLEFFYNNKLNLKIIMMENIKDLILKKNKILQKIIMILFFLKKKYH